MDASVIPTVAVVGIPLLLCFFVYYGLHELIKKGTLFKSRANGLLIAILSITNFLMFYKIIGIIHFF